MILEDIEDEEFNPSLRSSRRSLLVDLAQEILAMDEENCRLRMEVEELTKYRNLYQEELDRGLAHSQYMVGGLLKMAMTPGVVDALRSAHQTKKVS